MVQLQNRFFIFVNRMGTTYTQHSYRTDSPSLSQTHLQQHRQQCQMMHRSTPASVPCLDWQTEVSCDYVPQTSRPGELPSMFCPTPEVPGSPWMAAWVPSGRPLSGRSSTALQAYPPGRAHLIGQLCGAKEERNSVNLTTWSDKQQKFQKKMETAGWEFEFWKNISHAKTALLRCTVRMCVSVIVDESLNFERTFPMPKLHSLGAQCACVYLCM